MDAERILADLNPEQRRAVEAVRGPVCILAGAGSGKTTTITRRIANQVATGTFRPDEILAVTDRAGKLARQLVAFSRRQVLQSKVLDLNKVVGEMEQMVARLLGADIELVPKLDPKPVLAAYDKIGHRGILRGFVWGDQAGCWQHACCLMDVHNLILACYDKPDWVHRFLEILLEKKLRFVSSLKGAKFDLIETGGGAGSSTLISPALHREFCLPYDRKLHDALHAVGFPITYHTCGGTFGLEELIVANGCDASETLAPKSIGGNQEPWELAAKLRGRLALIGGVDQHNVLTAGPPARIRAAVHELFEKVGSQGGYICSLSDHFFDTPIENLEAFAAAARECTY